MTYIQREGVASTLVVVLSFLKEGLRDAAGSNQHPVWDNSKGTLTLIGGNIN